MKLREGEIQISQSTIVTAWEATTEKDWYVRSIQYTDKVNSPDWSYAYVWISKDQMYYAWKIIFTGISGLDHLEVPLFRLWELDAAKEYVDNIIKRAAKLTAFI